MGVSISIEIVLKAKFADSLFNRSCKKRGEDLGLIPEEPQQQEKEEKPANDTLNERSVR